MIKTLNFLNSQASKCLENRSVVSKFQLQKRSYGYSCPPSKPPKSCQPPSTSKPIVPAPNCTTGPIPYNPCCPKFHEGHGTYKKFKYIFLCVSLPVILLLSFQNLGHPPPHKEGCRDYEYMRLRSKRFPWGEGVKSLFHNDHTNYLPGECEPPDDPECD